MVAFFQRTLLACLFLLALAVPSFGQTPVYNEYEVGKLREFLNHPSAVAGKTNGEQVNAAYNPDNPSTFGVTWTWWANPDRQVSSIDWIWKSLAGDLNFSNFTLLESLWVIGNQFTTANVSGCTKLNRLGASTNQLTSLDVSGCSQLSSLSCDNNKLTSLNVSSLTNLTTLSLFNNSLKELVLSSNTLLSELACGDNQLTRLDVSGCSQLSRLRCERNKLTSLNLGSLTKLTYIQANFNLLKELDLSTNTLLSSLYCSYNQFMFSTLPIKSNLTYYIYSPQALITIGKDITVNGFTFKHVGIGEVIDLSTEASINGKSTTFVWKKRRGGSEVKPTNSAGAKFTFDASLEKETIYCEMRNDAFPNSTVNDCLTTVDVAIGNSFDIYNAYEVGKLRAFLNQPSAIAGKTNGQQVNAAYNPNDPSTFGVTWTWPAVGKRVNTINWNSKSLSGDLDLSNFIDLGWFYISFNQLKTVNFSGCTDLHSLWLENNQLTSIDVSGCRWIDSFRCQNNKLTSLDVSSLTELATLEAYSNSLVEFNLGSNMQLRELRCENNKLTSLNIGSLTKLTSLDVQNNLLKELDLSTNTLLSSLNCSNNQFKFSSLPVKSSLTTYNYSPQALLAIGNDLTVNGSTFKHVGINESIDLSSEATIEGKNTIFVWKKRSDGSEVKPTNSTGAKFTFDASLAKETIYCEMRNDAFPKFTNYDCLKTVDVTIGNSFDTYNTYEVSKLRSFLDQPSAVAGKTNGQQVNVAYNPNDPSTFEVTWTKAAYEKRVEGISWQNKNLSGDLNFSNFAQLDWFYVNGGRLKTANVSGCPMLSDLGVNNNQLTSVDVSGCRKLYRIVCDFNKLTFLNVGSLTGLKYIRTYNNSLKELDFSSNTLLSELLCGNNQLTNIVVSGCSQLSLIDCQNNKLTSLNVGSSTKLTSINANNNLLKKLTLSSNTQLRSLDCGNNQLLFSTLPVKSGLTTYIYIPQALVAIGKDMAVNGNTIKHVNVGEVIDLSAEATVDGKSTAFVWKKRSDGAEVKPTNSAGGKFTFGESLARETIYCEMRNDAFPKFAGDNCLKTVDVTIGNSFDVYNASEVDRLRAFLDLPSALAGKTNGLQVNAAYNSNEPSTFGVTWTGGAVEKKVAKIVWNDKSLSGCLDFPDFTQLILFQVCNNQLKTANVSGCTMLNELWINDNKLTSVDVSGCNQLSFFWCYNNKLTSLNVRSLSKLSNLACMSNQLKFSTLPAKSTLTSYTYATQGYIEIGRDTTINGNVKKYIKKGEIIDLSDEFVVSSKPTIFEWKMRKDNSKVTPVSNNGGKFTFSSSLTGEYIYCEMSNAAFPDFAGYKVLQTVDILVTDVYNQRDVSILKKFLQQESAIAGKKNYQNINPYSDLNDPSSWGDVEWTSSPINKRVKSIYWLKKDLAGSLILSGLDSLKSVEVMMNKITSISFDNCTRLEKIRLDEAGLTLLNTWSLTGLKRIDLNNSKISDIDLSSNSKLETAILRHNQLTSVKLPTSLTFKELDLKGNSFRLSTLPSAIGSYSTYYSYSSQKPMVIGVAVQENGKTIYQVGTYSTIDLSSEFTIAGKQTEYKWWNVSKNTYTTPYSSNGGKFTFDSSVVGDTLICEMKNEAFPLYDPVYPYSTVKVVVKAGYDEYEVGKLKAFLDQPSSEAGKTNGQKVNAAYDPNDPSTFGVTWTSVALDKKVTNIYWSNKGLKGDLDFSNFMQLTDLYTPYNQLITLEVIGCIVLKDLVIQENQLTSIDISNCNQLGNFNCRNNKLATINVSSLAKLTYLDVSNNSLASLDLSGNALLTSLICFYNQLKFSTLPVKSSLTNYSYIPQGLVIIGRDTTNAGNTFKYVGIGKTIDLSSEASINGNPTTFVWKKASDNSVVTPVTSVGGMFTFGSNLAGQTIYCEMSNATFPKFSGNDVLKTVGVVVGNDCYNAYEVEKLKVFLNQPSAVAGKSNGQQVNADYNENDPSTFGVWWSSSSLNKKVESISWVVKSLAGTLDCSNFSLLKYIFVWDNKLIGLNVDGAISLITLDVNSNLLASLNLSSNTKLTELGLRQNNFSYSTLPEKPTLVTTYLRAPQNMLAIGEKQVSGTIQKYVIGAEQVVDISKEYSVKGFQTSFTWKDSNGSVITPSTSSNGKFSFNSTFVGKKVYCEMANAGFSDFTGSSILRTVTVEILQAYNQNDVDKLKAFLNKPSAEAGKTNGQQVNASYNANDPATYGVNWSKHSANKRVVNFQWLTKNLAGDLDLSSCELLTVAWLSDNKLTSLNLKGCTELTDLDARMNELATVSMDSHPKLTSIDLSTNKLSSLSVVGVPNLSMLFLFNNQLTQLDLSKVTSLTRLKVYNNALTSLDISGLSKLQLLKAEQNKLTSVKFGSNAKLELVNLDGNMLSAVDVVGLPALKDLTVSNNKFNLSKIPSKNTTYTSYIYAPQPPMVVGHATQDGNITKYSIYADEPIDLSSELTIGGNTTTFVWKKADGTAVHPTSAAGGVFTFTNSFIGETIYGELTNSSFPDFAADKSYRTVQVTIQSPYNADEVAALTRFFNKPSAAAGSTNGEQIGITNKNNPSTWKGVTWSNEVLDRRVISIFWSGLNVSDTLNLTGFGKIGALDVTSNMLNKVVVDQTPLLKNVLLANNNLRFSTMPTIDSYDQYSSFPQSKLVVGTKSTDGLGDGYTLLAGEQVNLSGEYTVAGQITTFVWKDNAGNVIVPTKSNNGRFFFNKEFIGKKVHCELSNSKFSGGILETVEILIPGSQFEKNFGNKVSFILYPNPTTRSIKIEATDLIQSYRIFASNGVELLTAELNDFRLEIDVQRLRPGIYFIEIRVGSQAYRSKFIKQ